MRKIKSSSSENREGYIGNYSLNDSVTTYSKKFYHHHYIAHIGAFSLHSPIESVYDLQGNVAEMCYDGTKPVTIGGGWLESEKELDLFAKDKYEGITKRHANIGFRIVFTVTENKKHQKFVRKITKDK